MRRGLIVKGRRYYSPKFKEYVIAEKRGIKFATVRRMNGDIVRLNPANLFYVSADDYNLCDELATAAKMTWFYPGLDDSTNTEVNFEDADEHEVSSYRHAIRDLSEGLVNEDFKMIPDPLGYNNRFRQVLRGMGLSDPGDYV